MRTKFWLVKHSVDVHAVKYFPHFMELGSLFLIFIRAHPLVAVLSQNNPVHSFRPI